MSSISRRRLARGFVKQLEDDTRKPKEVVAQLAAYIVDNKLVSNLDLIIEDIKSEFETQLGRSTATVYSAHELSTSVRQEVAELIKRHSNTKDVEVIEEIEPSLLGGVKIETPSMEIDLSIKNKLKRLGGAIE